MIALYDNAGNVHARYTYDAWGKPLSITDGSGNDVSGNPNHMANINPFRYRNYYYDTETGFYYLNSRYYDPKTGGLSTLRGRCLYWAGDFSATICLHIV